MEIKRLGENKIRCALTEEEIKEMGFDIEEIIGNGDETQQFMRLLLKLIEEQENINLDNISPMVKAELLSDHSMALTFGGDSEMNFKDLMQAINQLMDHMTPDRMEEFKGMSKEEKQSILDSYLEQKEQKTERKEKTEEKSTKGKESPMRCALMFHGMEAMTQMCRACFGECMPVSALYQLEGDYFLLLDFRGFEKDEMRAFAFAAVEYDEGHISKESQIAYIVEHGRCIVKKEAIQMLMAL